ncbi:hypothetical protein SUDANB176_06360 [Streptomyces sp. enrichment culture]|uniref:hypothetical protein n=1 Tax=Streptomyces sp. enrichment culture TaxID=1795815 RepID=UPI003F54B12C
MTDTRPFTGLKIEGRRDRTHLDVLTSIVPEPLREEFRRLLDGPRAYKRIGRHDDRTYWLSQKEGSDLVTLEVVLPTYQSREEILQVERELMPDPLPPGAVFRTRPVSDPFDDSPETAAVLRRIDAALARGEHWSTVSGTTLESIRRDWLRSRGLY